MKEYILHIKHMVCPRCVMTVERILDNLQVGNYRVELGAVHLSEPLTDESDRAFKSQLESLGFEVLESRKSSLIVRIKALLVAQILYPKEALDVNISTFLSDKLHHDYGHLSRLFSSVEGVTIEKYVTQLKMEKVKELLVYDEMNLTRIAEHLNYSSVAYLSSQFKKETGMTPTRFRQTLKPERRFLDSI